MRIEPLVAEQSTVSILLPSDEVLHLDVLPEEHVELVLQLDAFG
jgi:hypothetical protein